MNLLKKGISKGEKATIKQFSRYIFSEQKHSETPAQPVWQEFISP